MDSILQTGHLGRLTRSDALALPVVGGDRNQSPNWEPS